MTNKEKSLTWLSRLGNSLIFILSRYRANIFLQKYPNELNHLFLWGSSGTGKTLLLIECLRIIIAKCKLQKPRKEMETFVLVYHENVDEKSELRTVLLWDRINIKLRERV